MIIGITGASGQLGRLVIEKLKSKVNPAELVALVRNPEKLEGVGVQARQADYTQPEILKAALSGVDVLLLISSNEIGQRATQHQNVIEAAQIAGVKRIVYTSLLHADTSTLSLAGEHVETEAALKSSGIPYTILRNGWYTENYTGALQGAVAAKVLVGSAGEGKISSATREDFAEAAAVVLTETGHENQVYELAGDQSWTLAELAEELSKQTGQAIPYKNLPESDYADVLKSVGLPDVFATAIASWDVEASKDVLYHQGGELSKLIARPTTTLSAAVERAV